MIRLLLTVSRAVTLFWIRLRAGLLTIRSHTSDTTVRWPLVARESPGTIGGCEDHPMDMLDGGSRRPDCSFPVPLIVCFITLVAVARIGRRL